MICSKSQIQTCTLNYYAIFSVSHEVQNYSLLKLEETKYLQGQGVQLILEHFSVYRELSSFDDASRWVGWGSAGSCVSGSSTGIYLTVSHDTLVECA